MAGLLSQSMSDSSPGDPPHIMRSGTVVNGISDFIQCQCYLLLFSSSFRLLLPRLSHNPQELLRLLRVIGSTRPVPTQSNLRAAVHVVLDCHLPQRSQPVQRSFRRCAVNGMQYSTQLWIGVWEVKGEVLQAPHRPHILKHLSRILSDSNDRHSLDVAPPFLPQVLQKVEQHSGIFALEYVQRQIERARFVIDLFAYS